MPRVTLTDLSIKALPLPEGSQVEYWDRNLRTFGVRVAKGGSKTFVIKQHQRRHVIGRYPIISLKKPELRRKSGSRSNILLSGASALTRLLKSSGTQRSLNIAQPVSTPLGCISNYSTTSRSLRSRRNMSTRSCPKPIAQPIWPSQSSRLSSLGLFSAAISTAILYCNAKHRSKRLLGTVC